MKMKSLKDISWDVPEEEYGADPALSYSTLAKYEREGFNNLDKLFNRLETPSLTFGSAVDSIITGGQEEFEERFVVAEFPSTPDSVVKIVKSLFSQYGDSYRSLTTISDDKIIVETECQCYQMNWKPETRVKVIKERGADYYNLLFIAGNKTILDTQTYQDVINAVRALKESEATKFYFMSDNPFDDIERYYQLKFKACLEGINYRCMMDLAVVDHKNKIITPCDLKTSGHPEWEFYKSFNDWSYHIQARLYWRLLKYAMSKDSYFKDFELADYKFIVVNKRTLTPLVWDCPYTKMKGTIKVGKDGHIEWRDPFEIGKELDYCLSSRPKVPMGINEGSSNDLSKWLNKI